MRNINRTERKPRESPLHNVFELRKKIALQKLRQGGTLVRVKPRHKSGVKEPHAQ